jgi:hypothetical protein
MRAVNTLGTASKINWLQNQQDDKKKKTCPTCGQAMPKAS